MYQPSKVANREAMALSLRSTLNELLSEKVADTHKMERLLSTNLAPATDLVHGGGPDRSGTMWPVPSMGLPTQELLVYKALQERVRSENASLLVNRALAAHRLGALTQQDSMLEAYMSAHMKATQMQGISFPTPQYLPHQMNYLMAEAQRRTAHPLSMAVAPRLEPSKISDEGPSKPSRATRNKMIDIMKTLGSSPRKRSDPLIDCVDFFDNADEKMAQPKLVFPERLHQLLREVEKDGLSDIVSFHPHGRSFAVHDMNRFVEEILPKWFKQSKWNSFARQLNLYGFTRIVAGPDAGGYYHALFLRGRPSLSRYMMRVGVPTGREDRRKQRPKNLLDTQDPDFYAMKSA